MKTLKNQFRKLDYLSEKQESILAEFLNAFCNDYQRKKDQLDFLRKHEIVKAFDTAIPVNVVKEMKELYPDFDTFDFIYDYSEKSFGELKNVKQLALSFIRRSLVLD